MRLFSLFFLVSICGSVASGNGSGPRGRSIFRYVSATRGPVERFGRFELRVELDSFYVNPYDYSEVALRCVFSGPGGRVDTVDGFYMTDYRIDTVSGRVLLGGGGVLAGRRSLVGGGSLDGQGSLVSGGGGHFAVRYSPVAPGRWRYRLFCETKNGRVWGPGGSFECRGGAEKGFVRSKGSPYLTFEDGTAFVPIGENLGWAHKNAYLDYRRWVSRLAANGGNFIRVWMPAWGLGLEWRKGWGGYNGLGWYQQSNAAVLDWLLDYCAREHVYVMLSLDHHGQVSSRVDPNWKDNPYNAANGGPCEHTWDFFTDATARALIRNRFRYIVARYGHSSSLFCWELFNEVDWTDDFAHHRAGVASWHGEMAAWLRRLDVNHHLVTTSFGDARWDPLTWTLPGIDFTQTHYYTNKPLDSVLSTATERYRRLYGKPTLTGEFGLSTTGEGLAKADPDGTYVHNALWATLLSGAMGAGLPWYWDNYIDELDLYSCFYGVAVFARHLDLIGHGYAPATVTVRPGSMRAYALRASDSSRLAVWMLNSRSGAVGGAGSGVVSGVASAAVPGVVGGAGLGVVDGSGLEAGSGAEVSAPGMRNGRYAVDWWNCRKGVVDAVDTVWVKDGVLRAPCPAVSWDKAMTAEWISEAPYGTSKGSGRTGE